MLIQRKRNLQYCTLLFIFSVAIFWKLLFTHEYSILTYPDSAHQTYPWSQFIAQTIHQGSFPFWDNYSDAGRSFIGEVQTGAFYPMNLLMGSFKLNSKGSRATLLIEGFMVFHCFLGSLFMYWLCRYLKLSAFSCFVSALIFSYSGSVGMRAQLLRVNILNSSIWLPLNLPLLLQIDQSHTAAGTIAECQSDRPLSRAQLSCWPSSAPHVCGLGIAVFHGRSFLLSLFASRRWLQL